MNPAPREGSDQPIERRIDRAYAQLGPQEQRVADALMDRLADVAVHSAAELAELSGTSKATVSRFFRRLGYAGSAEAREDARALRGTGVPLGGSAGPHGPQGFAAHLEQERRNLALACTSLAEQDPDAVAGLLAGARRVLVVGFRNSHPVALHLRQQLLQCRPDVHLAPQPGQSLGEELAGLGDADAVVLVGFRRRPRGFAALARAVAEGAAASVLLTDAAGRRHGAGFTHVLQVPTDGVGAFDSYAAVMSTVSLLAGGVLAARPREGRRRVAGITALYTALEELEGR
ncbi:MurR/RpiR family transcriptional regulator [Kineococcus gypseus]|uniref:MurR/RpiR family transcriptional regulator n=1 Tax=Kineococcus gypseus TaxID=1637102 RepID=UPI003D7CB07C